MSRPSTRVALPFAVIAFALGACGPKSPTPQADGASAKQEASPAAEAEPGEAVPVIACDEDTFDFGSITPSEKVTHVFKLKNRGTADLHIERVKRT